MSTRITSTATEKYLGTVRYYSKEEEYVLKIIEIYTAKVIVAAPFISPDDAIVALELIMQGLEALEEKQSN